MQAAYKAINEQIKHIAESKDAIIAEEKAKNKEKRLAAKSVSEQCNELADYIITYTEYRESNEVQDKRKNENRLIKAARETNDHRSVDSAFSVTKSEAGIEGTAGISEKADPAFTHINVYNQMELFSFEDGAQKSDTIKPEKETSVHTVEVKSDKTITVSKETLFSSGYMRRNLYLPPITGKTEDGRYTVSCNSNDLTKPREDFNKVLTKEALRREIDAHIRRDLIKNNGKLTVANEASSPYYNELIKPVLAQYDTKQKCMEKIINPIVQKQLNDMQHVLQGYADMPEAKALLTKLSEMTDVVTERKRHTASPAVKNEKPIARAQNEFDI